MAATIAISAAAVWAQALPIEETAKTQATNAAAVYSLKSGSYYLSRNILVKGAKNAINVTSPNVSIDFHGYSIIGKSLAAGVGVYGPGQSGLTIQNGNIQGMVGGGVVVGPDSSVRSMHITSSGPGIVGGSSCLIEDNTVTGSTSGDGISAAGVIRSNVSDGNAGNGITAGANSSIMGNEASGNSGVGIAMQSSDGFSNNVINGGTTVSGGVDAGGNVCNGSATCP
ncbi:MAG TPA: hypothetical protein VMV15_01030 [Candidatus Binataceae bacterium]|nr:hypothetical protein [Candidatus Binataceae bacterium]